MTKEEALDMLYEGDLYDAFGYVTADGYEALAALDGVVLQERKTGKWVKDEHGTDHCSCCDYIPAYDTAIDDIYYSPYCPNCGAKMEVDDE